MLSYYNKYYTRLQVIYYATLATRLYLSRAYERGGGGFKHPLPPLHTQTELSDFVFKSDGKRKRLRGGVPVNLF